MAQRMVVGMSGGVDSAVAAWLTKQQGYETIGVFMNNWEETDENGACTAEEDFADVKACCNILGIPYYSVNFAQEYMERVFAHFLEEYKKGRTPNPDVLCNREIKFGVLLQLAEKLGTERLVTGHYARVEERDGYFRLCKAADLSKDQSYFLYMLRQPALSKACFPLGNMLKADVRRIAQQEGLPVAKKKDSTGVCFIGERNFKNFLSNYLPAKPGVIRDEYGKYLGRHDGLMYYTIGQRGGMGIGGIGDGRAWYVAHKDLSTNTLIAVQGADHPLLYSDALYADELTFTCEYPAKKSFDCAVKIRYRQEDQQAHVELDGNSCLITFDKPQRAVTPGQSAVFYIGEECIGGGIIR